MKVRNGCLGQEDILRVRLAIKEARDIDTRIFEVLKEAGDKVLCAEDDHEVVGRALEEVRERLHYLASLDALWANIEVLQDRMGSLRTYEYLEKQCLEQDVDCDAYDGESLKEFCDSLGAFTDEGKEHVMEVQTAVMEEVDFGEEEPQPYFGREGLGGRMTDLGAEAHAAPFLGPNDPRLLQYCSCRRKKANKKAGKKAGSKDRKKAGKSGKKEGQHLEWLPDSLTSPVTDAMVHKMAKKAKKAVKKAEKKAAKQEKKARRKLKELF